ncbi:MAG: flagellar motor protein MotB [Marinosulfonomonas sp.]
MGAKQNAPVIIKRKKVSGGGGHHGGAWKVAYADFVTAMMAFFMLMWLLNATTETQRKGIADYFSPTIPINRISGGGDGSFGGDSVFSEDTLAQNGTGATSRRATNSDASRGDSGTSQEQDELDRKNFGEIENALTGRSGESMVSNQTKRHIVTRVTDEGLIVEVFDLPGEPLFEKDTDQPLAVLDAIVAEVAQIFGLTENAVALNGFVRAEPIVLAHNPNWDLSSARAQKARELLEQNGFEPARVQRVTGFADRKPAATEPMAARNNRLEFILLRDVAPENM